MAYREEGVQHDPVHAVTAAIDQVPVSFGEVIGYAPTAEPTRSSHQDISHTAPEGGPLLPGEVPDGAEGTFGAAIWTLVLSVTAGDAVPVSSGHGGSRPRR